MTTAIATLRRQVRAYPVFATWLMFLGVMLLVGLVSAAAVLWVGLDVTNLSNRVPWGLWITVDLSAIALGAGAVSLSTIVYIFRAKSFAPIAAMAVSV